MLRSVFESDFVAERMKAMIVADDHPAQKLRCIGFCRKLNQIVTLAQSLECVDLSLSHSIISAAAGNKGLRQGQTALASLSTGTPSDGPDRENLNQFLAGLPVLWRLGEVRPTHRKADPKARHWRTRPEPFKNVWADILLWLQKEPDQTAKGLLQRLIEKYPGQFSPKLLRTLQRRVGDGVGSRPVSGRVLHRLPRAQGAEPDGRARPQPAAQRPPPMTIRSSNQPSAPSNAPRRIRDVSWMMPRPANTSVATLPGMTPSITIQASTTSPRSRPMTASGPTSSSNGEPKNLPSAAGAGKKIKRKKPAQQKPTNT